MKTRTQRLLAIRKIIGSEAISSQDDLLKKLIQSGFDLTQATLSRDLKFLQAGKRPDKQNGYVYTLPGNAPEINLQTTPDNFPLNGFISLEFAHSMALIKTLPAYAGSIASAIDSLDAFEVIGTIAGDDTILIIPREGVSREDLINALAVLIPVE